MKHWISPDIKYKTFMKNKNCKKEFGSCQCPDCIIPVRNDSSKTWQERFEEEFWGKFGSTKTINEIKQFISQAINQTREETIESIVKYIRENLTAGESWERGDIYININNVETLGSGSFNWDNEFWDELKNDLLNNLKQ